MIASTLLTAYLWRGLFVPLPAEEVTAPALPDVSMSNGRGTLTVTTEDIPSGTIPRGANAVRMQRVTLHASCDADIAIHGMEVRHEGRGNVRDISSVFAVQDSRRLTRAARFNPSSRSAFLRLNGIVIPACETMTADIVASFRPQAAPGGEHGIAVAGADTFTSGAAKTVLSPILDTVRVRAVGNGKNGVRVAFLPVEETLRFNAFVTAGRIRITADDDRDYSLRRITLRNDGTARGKDLQNIFLEESATRTKVTREMPFMDNDAIVLYFHPPLALEAGSSVTLDLKGEARGRIGRTVRFALKEDGDFLILPSSTTR